MHERGQGVARKGLVAREHLINKHPGRKQIGTSVGGQALHLLGRHIAGRAQYGAHLRQARGLQLRDAKVANLHRVVRAQHHVGGLHIAVHHAQLVRKMQAPQKLRSDVAHALRLHGLASVQELLQATARDIFHGDVGGFVVFTILIHRHDGGVGEPPRRLGFALEALQKALGLGGIEQAFCNGFNSDLPLDHRVAGQIDHAHAAPAQLPLQLVFADLFTCGRVCLMLHGWPPGWRWCSSHPRAR